MLTIVTMQSRWWCPMCGGYGMGGGGMMFMWVFWVVVVGVVLWALLRYSGLVGRRAGDGGRSDGAEAILRKRYARGEIDEATFQHMMEELRRGR